MKLSQLEQIIEVANTGSISQAASNLYISQPNVSLSVKRVEDEIGAKLFHRTSSGMIPTVIGVEFVERAKEILLQLNSLGYICGKNESITQKLTIASAGLRILETEAVHLIKKYKQTPMQIKLLTATGPTLLDYVSEGKAELGFCAINNNYTKNMMIRQATIRKLEYHTISEVSTGIYVGRNNPNFTDDDKVVDFEKIKDLPIIRISRREFNGPNLQEQIIESTGIPLNPSQEIIVDNFGSLRSVIVMLNGYALSTFVHNKSFYDYEAPFPEIRFIPFEPGIFNSEFGYIQRENTIRSPLANELLNNVKRRFAV